MQPGISLSRGRFSLVLGFLAILLAPTRDSLAEVVSLESPALSFQWSSTDGSYRVEDKATRTVWESNPYQPRFGEIVCSRQGQSLTANLGACDVRKRGSTLTATFHPLTNQPSAWVKVTIQLLKHRPGLRVVYAADPALAIDKIQLLDNALWTSNADHGYVVVPTREGLLIPADSGKAFDHRFDTYAYEGCHMAMVGIVKGGATALITWDDPYTAVIVESRLAPKLPADHAPVQQCLAPSLVLRKSARACQIEFCGSGDYVTLAKSYRQQAQGKGWWVPWALKLKGHPERARLFGAINFKLWSALSRSLNEESTQEKSSRLNWTFDEAAQIAEHLKQDLQLDRVLFTVGGWIHRGYDNQHPDILPAAPECGGNSALADCARRVENLGYLFCLHDNYQDIYRDSPSWNENYIMRTDKGELARGGVWAGGRAYLTCSPKALALAKRPQNLPAVRKITGANAYFIDTTYAAGLQECFDPQHPLTRTDDMKAKQALSDYARRVFGVFGSECGREWAIPHSDFFEGLTGVSGHDFHDTKLSEKVGGVVVPLFEIVYRDTIAMYGKYGYDIYQSAPYVLQHLILGRTLNYHNVPSHLYWKSPRSPEATNRLHQPQAVFVQANDGWGEKLHPYDRFVKNTAEILSPLNEITSQSPLTQHEFLTPDRKAQRSLFGSGQKTVEVVVNAGEQPLPWTSLRGHTAILPSFGFLVDSPEFAAFYATDWQGSHFTHPTLFTVRSLDGKPWEKAKQLRVYHGFGDPRIQIGQATYEVPTERVINISH